MAVVTFLSKDKLHLKEGGSCTSLANETISLGLPNLPLFLLPKLELITFKNCNLPIT